MKAIVLTLLLLCALSNYSQDINKSEVLGAQFNGQYSLCSNDSDNRKKMSLWEHLKPFDRDTLCKNSKGYSFEIKVLDEKRIAFNLLNGSTLAATKIMRYKSEGDVIIIPKFRNRLYWGFPILFFTTRAERLNLSINDRKELLIDYKGASWGMLFFLASGITLEGHKSFERSN